MSLIVPKRCRVDIVNRTYVTVETMVYEWDDKKLTVEAGFVTDLASLPRIVLPIFPKISEARAKAACLALVALSWLLLLGGCAAHSHPAPVAHYHARAHGVRVVVAKGHLHSARCGHYHHRGHWYHLRGHVHGPRCGHALVRNVWVLRG